MTYSGILVERAGAAGPALLDIALGLSRQPRFAGQCRRWWSVLDHSLFAAEMAARDGRNTRTVLAILLHDAHEALTGDTPTSLKTDDQRAVQHDLDQRIARDFFPGGAEAFARESVRIKEYDARALLAEALVVGPPSLSHITPAEFLGHFGGLPRKLDCDTLRDLLRESLVGRPEVALLGAEAPNVRQYVELCASLRQAGN